MTGQDSGVGRAVVDREMLTCLRERQARFAGHDAGKPVILVSPIMNSVPLSTILLTTLSLQGAHALDWGKLPKLPNERGVAAPFAGVSGGSLIVAGGANFPDKMPWDGGKKQWLDEIWALNSADGKWQLAGKLPRPLAYGVSVTTPDGVICVGGSDSTKHYADAFRIVWSAKGITIEHLPPLPIPLANASGAMVANILHVACGSETPGEATASARCFQLDFSASPLAWKESPAFPGPARFLATAASDNKAFYLFGGACLQPAEQGAPTRIYLKDAWKFTLNEGWKQLVDLLKPNVAAPSPAPWIDGKFWLAGGDDGSRVGFKPLAEHPGFPKECHAFDPLKNEWSLTPNHPAPRATVPTVEWLGRYVIPSGEARPGVRSAEIWTLSSR